MRRQASLCKDSNKIINRRTQIKDKDSVVLETYLLFYFKSSEDQYLDSSVDIDIECLLPSLFRIKHRSNAARALQKSRACRACV